MKNWNRKFSKLEKTLLGTNGLAIIFIVLLTVSLVSAVAVINVYLDDLPATATYTIKTDGTNYWAVRYDGYKAWDSTNASYTVNSVIATGVTISFASGRFIFTSPIALNKDFVTLEGGGVNNTVLTAGANGLTIIDCQQRNNKGLVIRNLAFDGNNATYTGGIGINFTGYYSIVENLYIYKFENIAFNLEKSVSSSASHVDNFISNIRIWAIEGDGFVWGKYGGSAVTHDNYFQNIVVHGVGGNGITLYGSSHQAWNLNSYSNGGNGIVNYGSNQKFVSGVADGNGLNGILLSGTSGVYKIWISDYSIKSNSQSVNATYEGILSTTTSWVTHYVTIVDCDIRSEITALPYMQNYAFRAYQASSSSVIEIRGGIHKTNAQLSPPWSFSSATAKVIGTLNPLSERVVTLSVVTNGTYVAHGIVYTPSLVLFTLSVQGYAWYGTLNATHIRVYANVATISGKMYVAYMP